MKHPFLAVIAACLLLVQFIPGAGAKEATPATTPADPFAFGWAVVVLEDQPVAVTVGEETVVPFKVLHQGRVDREVEGAIVVFTIRHVESGDPVTEIAQLLPERAAYEATFTLDRAGPWQWTAFVYNVGSMNPQATFLPELIAVDPGSSSQATATPVATPAPGGPGYVMIETERLTPWLLEVPLGLKVLFVNESDYPVSIFFGDGGSLDEVERLDPGSSTMWYSTVPGEYLFTVGPAPAFRVGAVIVNGDP